MLALCLVITKYMKSKKYLIKRTLKLIEKKELLEIKIIQKLGEMKKLLNIELKKYE